jgi:periplasmic protein CpxP/Spy
MKLSRTAISAYMGLVLVCGAVLGVVGDRAYTAYTSSDRPSPGGGKGKDRRPFQSPEEYRKGYLGFMQKRLKLDDQQVLKLGLILDETRARMNDIHERTVPEQQEVQKAQTEKIRALLTPEQISEYEVMLKERKERMKKGGGPRGGPGGF